MIKVGVVSVSRSDYSILLPLITAIKHDQDLQLNLLVSGMHLKEQFGSTINQILKDGFVPSSTVDNYWTIDTEAGIAKAIGYGTIGFANTFENTRPDILILLGDRFEMYAAGIAALPFNIPIAHIHGGEVTNGAIDDSIRHSLTKLSHLHLVSTDKYANRVIQLGEEPWRVKNTGAMSLEILENTTFLSALEISDKYGIDLGSSFLLVTFHPVTREHQDSQYHINELLLALQNFDMPIIFTAPNADTSRNIVHNSILHFVDTHSRAHIVTNLGPTDYFSVMKLCTAMVGNSSSGVIEASSTCTPVVNVGSRQDGRVKGSNVIDVDYDRENISQAISKAIHPNFKESIKDISNPYYKSHPSAAVLSHIKSCYPLKNLLSKRFHDVTFSNSIR